MREIRSYGSVGVSAGNRRHYPAAKDEEVTKIFAEKANI